jgi:hypothetical protein
MHRGKHNYCCNTASHDLMRAASKQLHSASLYELQRVRTRVARNMLYYNNISSFQDVVLALSIVCFLSTNSAYVLGL